MIRGLGLDVCEIARIRNALSRHGERFLQRIVTTVVCAFCQKRTDPAVPFAGRFAAKEATIKALGNPDGLRWHDMEVLPDSGGAPRLSLTRVGLEVANRLGASRFHLSITHDAGVAAAVVVLE